MITKIFRPLLLPLFFLTIMLGASSKAFATATIVILNNDAAGVGFNDTTPATPVGGNTGTTIGQQRLIAFQAAADKWGATLDSNVTITIRAQWTALTCTATTAVLGSAGAIQIFRDYAGAPFASTWYNESLAGKILGADPDPATPEINANFNVNLGKPGCLEGSPFYLGLDNNHGSNIDLVTVLTHEFGHGLGFQTFTNSSTGAFNSGFPSIFDRFLMDLTNGKSWLQMTNAERAASAIKAHKLAWNGPQVQADVPSVLAFGIPVVRINSPAGIAGRYDAGTASYGPQPSAGGVTGDLLLANDGTAPVTDGCEAFPAGFFNGKIAVIDRGTCSFKTKTLNAQNAGATAVIIVNNAAGSPAPGLGDDATITTPITIPTVSLTQPDGNIIKAQLGGTVNGTVLLDTSVRAGADPFNKALMFSPDPFTSGSSVSHWDTIAFPNQLMEPNINGDLTHEVTPPNDLTYSEMRDIGWVVSAIPSGISKTGGDNQNTALNQPFSTPLSVTVSPAIAGITVTWTANAGGAGANGSFPSTGNTTVSVTNASGVATAPPLTANGTSGFFSVNATAPGAGTTTFNVSIDPAPVLGPACLTDTTQADFAAGITSNTDVNASPGNVVLLNPSNPDQTQTVASTSGTGFNTTQWLGQTFVPGVTGNLSRIDMALFCASCSGTDQPITIDIRTTTGSPALPTSTVLATTTIAGFNSGVSGNYTVTFATPAALAAGTTYAYTLRLVNNRTGTYAAVFGNAPTDYPNGNRVVSTNSGATWTVPTSGGTARDLVFTTYMQTGNAASGNYTSSLKDSNPPGAGTTQWGTLSWNATVPAGTTLQFQAAASNNFVGPFNFVGPDGTASTFFTNGASLAQFNGLRYLKYKAFFTTTSGTATPTLSDVTVCYNNPLNLSITDVAQAEGNSGTTTFTFTVSLDSPAPTGGVTFNASTADGTATTANNDFVGFTNQAHSIPAGSMSTTVGVTVNGDTVQETNETFFVNLTGVTNASVADAQGQGTILNDDGAPSAGQIVISEFRFRGPTFNSADSIDGRRDEYIELYNNTASPITVATSDGSNGWTIAALSSNGTTAIPLILIPNGTVIPARAHYLVVNSDDTITTPAIGLSPTGEYSLENYAVADDFYTTDIADNAGVAVFTTSTTANFNTGSRLDAVGFSGNAGATADLFREGAGLTSPGANDGQYAFVRNLRTGVPQDTNDNVADFVLISTNGGTYGGLQSILGAPGPENCGCHPNNQFTGSPVQYNATIKASLIEPQAVSTAPPNRIRTGAATGPNAAFGTLELRRRFTNTTGAPVSRLRFRVVDMTTLNSPNPGGQQADMRWLDSSDIMVTTSRGALNVRGTVVQTPPAQASAGGLNTSGTVVPIETLAPGATIDVRFVLGVQQNGRFSFLLNIEANLDPVAPFSGGKATVRRKAKQ